MANPEHTEVTPLKGILPWIGGKRLLAKRLVAMIEATSHSCYVEPFVGAGGVFFRRGLRAKAECINDLSGDLVTLYRLLQRHPEALLKELEWALHSRSEFARLLATPVDTLTDLERARRFVLLQAAAFGGKVAGRTFGISPTDHNRFSGASIRDLFRAAAARLDRVTIEQLDYGQCIERWDRPDTLLYLDPPYHGCEHYYGKGMFERADFERLAEQLRGVRGQWIVSINDTPEIREIFGWARLVATTINYSAARNGGRPGRELIIMSEGINDQSG